MSDVPTSLTTACTHCGLPVPASRRDASPAYCCWGCRWAGELAAPVGEGAETGARGDTLFLRLGLAIFLTVNIMAFNGLVWARDIYGTGIEGGALHGPVAGLFAYLMMAFATGVVALVGVPLAVDSLRLRLDANLLIVIGVGAAYVLSVVRTLGGQGGLYFDTAALILVLVALGNALEASAKRRAARAASDLLAGVPSRAWVRRGADTVEVDAAQLVPGDLVRARPGEQLAVDGVIAEGRAHLDEASLTGEPRPRAAAPGDRALAGTLSLDGLIWVAASHTGDDRVLARTQALLHEARLAKPPIQRVTDRAARAFVPLVLLLALAVFAFHAGDGRFERGLFDGLSVLLIACPCALGLAAPLALWMALHRAARRGVLIDSAATLEHAASVKRVYFDKTGTLTETSLSLGAVVPYAAVTADQALAWAAAVEASSLHPVARAVSAAARERSLAVASASAGQAVPGLGVSAEVGGRQLWLGSARLAAERGFRAEPSDEAQLDVYLGDHERILARLSLIERPRTDAAAAIAALRQLGLEIAVLSGDAPRSAERLGQALGLAVEGGLLPADKLARLEQARVTSPAALAVVGDGINDAPMLAAADVGFVVGTGSDLAKRAGNVWLLADRLERVPWTLALSRRTMRLVRLNLLWAFGYNSVGLVLAALGLLNPVLSAAAMFGSSLFIIHTSRRAGAESDTGAAEAS